MLRSRSPPCWSCRSFFNLPSSSAATPFDRRKIVTSGEAYSPPQHGAGIAQVLRFAAEDDLAAGRLVEILPDPAMAMVPMHVVHAFGRQLPVRARLFINFLVERMEAIGR
jgi:hypothetical protein